MYKSSLKKFSIFLIQIFICVSSLEATDYNSWQSIGPYSGDVRVIVARPNNTPELFVASYGGIYKSTDGGLNWISINGNLSNVKIQTIVPDPNNDNKIYIGTESDGVFQSENDGVTWTANNYELSNLNVTCLVIVNSTILAGTLGGGIFSNATDGDSWLRQNDGLNSTYIYSLNSFNDVLYATTQQGLYQSQNKGKSWSLVHSALEFTCITSICQASDYPDIFYLGTFKKGVYRLDIATNTLETLNEGLDDLFIQALTCTNSRNPVLFAGTYKNGIFRRDLQSSSWHSVTTGIQARHIRTLYAQSDNPNIILAGTLENGLYKTVDQGDTWYELNNNLTMASTSGIVFHPEHPAWLFTSVANGIFVSKEFRQWEIQLFDMKVNDLAASYSVSDFKIFAATEKNGIIYSKDDGKNWYYMNSGLSNFAWDEITCFTATESNQTPYLIGTQNGSVYRFSGIDSTWIDLSGEMANTFSRINTIAVDNQEEPRIFIGCKQGFYYKYAQNPWRNYNTTLPKLNTNITSIVFDPQNFYTLYCTITDEGVYKSFDRGGTWQSINNTLPTTKATVIAVHPENTERLFLGTNARGIFASFDGGTQWIDIKNNFSNQTITRISIRDSLLIAGTQGSGCFQLILQPQISVSNVFKDFDEVDIGSTETWNLTINNSGLSDLKISSIQNNDSHYIITPQAVAISPQENQDITINFRPTERDWYDDKITITSNDPFYSETQVTLRGKGVAPIISASDTTNIDFGLQTIKQTSTRIIQLINRGDGELHVTNIEFINPKFGYDDTTDFWIPPFSDRKLTLRFSPDSLQAEYGTMIIHSNDNNRRQLTISLTGTGGAPVFNADQNTLDFSAVPIGSTKKDSIRLKNDGNTTLFVNRIEITNQLFQLIGEATFSLRANESRYLKISFTPDTIREEIGSINIYSNEPEETRNPLILNLKAQGISQSTLIATNAEQINLNGIEYNSAKDTTITLYNSGALSLQVNVICDVPFMSFLGSPSFNVTANSSKELQFRINPTELISFSGNILIIYRITHQDTLRIPVSANLHFESGVLTQKFNGGNTQNTFRMFSAPAILEQQNIFDIFESVLGTYSKKKWRLFRWKDGQYAELKSNLADTLSPGKAFWFMSKTDAEINFGAGLTVPIDKPYQIILAPGWNQVGNPFSFDVSWSDITRATNSTLLSQPYYYKGEYEFSNVLTPKEGYWIENRSSDSPIELLIPPQETLTLAKNNLWEQAEWTVRIEATCGQVKDRQNIIGISGSAQNEWDCLDFSEPPPIGDFVSVSFPHYDWADFPNKYTTDFRQSGQSGWEWNFEISSNINSEIVQLDFKQPNDIPQNMEILLIDFDNHFSQDLRQKRNYTFNTGKKSVSTHQFKLLIGSGDFIENSPEAALLVPREFKLAQNYPNPFTISGLANNSTTYFQTVIRYELPKADEVTLVIYDITGRIVRHLEKNCHRASGAHLVNWNGRDDSGQILASGIYFYSLKSTRCHATRKLILIR